MSRRGGWALHIEAAAADVDIQRADEPHVVPVNLEIVRFEETGHRPAPSLRYIDRFVMFQKKLAGLAQMRFLGDVRAGEVLVADCHWRTLVARSADEVPSLSPIGDVTGANRRWVLDFSSQWLRLQAGENVLQLEAGSWGEGAKAVVVFRSGWMG